MFALIVLLSLGTNSSVLTVPLVTTTPQDRWMEALADCESSASTTIRVWDTNNKWSVGKYQYQYGTWLKYSKLFGTTRENIFSGDLQDTVTRYILDHDGKDNWWTCSRVVEKSLGAWNTLDKGNRL